MIIQRVTAGVHRTLLRLLDKIGAWAEVRFEGMWDWDYDEYEL